MSRCHKSQHCTECDQLLIHQGSRLGHESASELGQLVHDILPPEFTWIDIDGALYRRSISLLRLFEHKSQGQHRKGPQRELLVLLARIMEHAKICDDASREFRLHERSGVFLIESNQSEEDQLGPSRITRLYDGETFDVKDEFKMLCWLALFKEQYVRDKMSRRKNGR